MWYLITSFIILIVSSKGDIKEVILPLVFLVYLMILTLGGVELLEYVVLSTSCLFSYVIYKAYNPITKYSLIDTLATCSFKILELTIIVHPTFSYKLPMIITSYTFSLDYIFIIFVLWSIILTRVNYKIKSELTDYKNFYSLCLIVFLNIIAYIF